MRTHLEGNRQHDDGDELEDALEEVGLVLGVEGGGQVGSAYDVTTVLFAWRGREEGRRLTAKVGVSGWMC